MIRLLIPLIAFLLGDPVWNLGKDGESNEWNFVADGTAFVVVDRRTGEGIPQASIEVLGKDLRFETDREGRALVRLEKGEWQLAIRSAGYATHFHKILSPPLGDQSIRIELGPEARVFGTVRDENGEPVSNALVTVADDARSSTPSYGQVRSDRTGRYELRGIPLNTRLSLEVTIADYADAPGGTSVPVDRSQVKADLHITKRSIGGQANLLVVDRDGKPIEGATIINRGNGPGESRTATTDQRGRATLMNTFETYRGPIAYVQAAGYITQETLLVVGPQGHSNDTVVRLEKGHSIRGRLVAPDGMPAANVRVYFNHSESGYGILGGRMQTDVNGRFHFDGLPSPSTFTFATPSPFAPIVHRELPVGTDEEVVVTMEPEGFLRLRAIDEETGKGLPEYNVKLAFTPQRQLNDPVYKLSPELVNQGKTVVGESSEFRLGQLPPGMPFQITISAKGYAKKIIERVEATQDTAKAAMRILLKPEDASMFRVVTGRLSDPAGKPVVNVDMKLIVGEEDPLRGNWLFYHWQSIESGEVQKAPQCVQYLQTKTDKEGYFRFDGVRVSPWIELTHAGGSVANGRHVIVDPENAPSLQDLELIAPFPGSLKVVIDRKKHPEAHTIRVEAKNWPASQTPFAYVTKKLDESDWVLFSNLPPGTYQVSLEAEPKTLGFGNLAIQTIKSNAIEVVEDLEATLDF